MKFHMQLQKIEILEVFTLFTKKVECPVSKGRKFNELHVEFKYKLKIT